MINYLLHRTATRKVMHGIDSLKSSLSQVDESSVWNT